jgi:transcription elongation factor GreA
MMSEPPYLTAEGAVKLKEELERLRGVERNALAWCLREAVSQGDLSENADYHKAKEDQGFLEGRIQELEHLLKNAIIVEIHTGKRETVDIGARVTVQEEDYDPEVYWLVGAKEADSQNRKISNESPVGRALMGKRVGDVVSIVTPSGQMQMKILAIE